MMGGTFFFFFSCNQFWGRHQCGFLHRTFLGVYFEFSDTLQHIPTVTFLYPGFTSIGIYCPDNRSSD